MECEGCEKTARHRRLSSLRLEANTVTSWGKKKKEKKPQQPQKKLLIQSKTERRRGERKGGRNTLRFHHLLCCLEWKHPGTIRRDVTSGFPHGSESSEPLGFCSTPCLNNAAGILRSPCRRRQRCWLRSSRHKSAAAVAHVDRTWRMDPELLLKPTSPAGRASQRRQSGMNGGCLKEPRQRKSVCLAKEERAEVQI